MYKINLKLSIDKFVRIYYTQIIQMIMRCYSMVKDNEGKIFEDRRKQKERRKRELKVEAEQRKKTRRKDGSK